MFLGIEIGGTKLQLGLGKGDGALAGLLRGRIEPAEGPEGIRRQIVDAVPKLLDDSGIGALRGVGIGFGGPVDDKGHEVIKSHQIPGWDHFPLADWIGSFLHLPAWLANDSDAAGLAEALFGAGKGLSPIYYLNIGSGIGGGFVQNGEVYRGTGRGAAETGHLRIAWFRRERGELAFAPLELLASGWSIERRMRGLAKLMPGNFEILRSLEGDPAKWTTALIAQAAQKGDRAPRLVMNFALDALAEAICHVVALLCPRRIVIGGGVALLGEELLFAPLRKRVAKIVFAPFAECFDIVPAALGEEVVVHGALAIARKNSENA